MTRLGFETIRLRNSDNSHYTPQSYHSINITQYVNHYIFIALAWTCHFLSFKCETDKTI